LAALRLYFALAATGLAISGQYCVRYKRSFEEMVPHPELYPWRFRTARLASTDLEGVSWRRGSQGRR